jgi:signal transduction histidine kinase
VAGGGAEIDIVDDGPGIAAELIERAFEPFERLGRADGGSGLGLPIMRGVASKLGAALELGSGAPHGLRVRLRLPG